MNRMQQINKMFEEIGLGTENDRNKFNNTYLKQDVEKEDIVFIKYSSTTKKEEEGDNA